MSDDSVCKGYRVTEGHHVNPYHRLGGYYLIEAYTDDHAQIFSALQSDEVFLIYAEAEDPAGVLPPYLPAPLRTASLVTARQWVELLAALYVRAAATAVSDAADSIGDAPHVQEVSHA